MGTIKTEHTERARTNATNLCLLRLFRLFVRALFALAIIGLFVRDSRAVRCVCAVSTGLKMSISTLSICFLKGGGSEFIILSWPNGSNVHWEAVQELTVCYEGGGRLEAWSLDRGFFDKICLIKGWPNFSPQKYPFFHKIHFSKLTPIKYNFTHCKQGVKLAIEVEGA